MAVKLNIIKPISRLTTYLWWKTVIDRFLALCLLIILSPVMAGIALTIRLESPGNPIFCQERIGKDGRRFTFYKFRSMYRDHDDSKFQEYWKKYIVENNASLFNEKGEDVYQLIDDPRITKVGGLIRRFDLDELPQLINVFKGDMSFVGPRPDIAFAVQYYQDRHHKRFSVKPGITGLWQTLENRRRISFEDMISLDMDYIQRQSLGLDVKIVLLTLRELVSFGRRQREVREVKLTNGIKA